MLKKVILHPPSPVRAETRTFPELCSRFVQRLNVPHVEGACLGRLGEGWVKCYASPLGSLRLRPGKARLGVPGWAGETVTFLNILRDSLTQSLLH